MIKILRPDEKDFETHKEFINAYVRYKCAHMIEERKMEKNRKDMTLDEYLNLKLEHEYEMKVSKENSSKYFLKVKKFSSKISDFESVIDKCNVNLPSIVQNFILTSEVAPHLMYELAKDEKWLRQICKMSPIEAVNDLIFFESTLNFR